MRVSDNDVVTVSPQGLYGIDKGRRIAFVPIIIGTSIPHIGKHECHAPCCSALDRAHQEPSFLLLFVRIARSAGNDDDITPAHIVLDASLEVRGAIIYATLIDAVTLLPIFFIGGLSGAFFQPLALAYGLAVLASLLVALTVTPALSLALLAGRNAPAKDSPVTRWTRAAYAAVLRRANRSFSPRTPDELTCQRRQCSGR